MTGGQNIYNVSNVASRLGISNSTLRKYCLLLEEHDYKFQKNKYNQRIFIEKDVMTLIRLIDIKKHPDMTLKQACKVVMTGINNNESVLESDTDFITSQEFVTMIDLIKSVISDEINIQLQEQKQLIKLLLERVEEQNILIKQLSKRRDHDLVNSIQQSQFEVATSRYNQEKRGFFTRFFNEK